MKYNILLPFDGSANSLKVMDFFKDLAFKLNSEVTLLKVFDLPPILLMDQGHLILNITRAKA